MKPPPFSYVRPESVPDVLSCLARWGEDGKIVAGGQSLIPLLNLRLARPEVLIDIAAVDGLSGVRAENGSIVVRAGTTQRNAERSPQLTALCPLVRQALSHVAHPQIRVRGTIGGNLAHGDAASELPAVAVALDAEFTIEGLSGPRHVRAPRPR